MFQYADYAVWISPTSLLTCEVVPLNKLDSSCISALNDLVAFCGKTRSSRDFWKRAVLRHAGFSKDYDSDDEEDAQAIKKILANRSTRTRLVFRQWPRDPKGKIIKTPSGKHTPNGLLWGATLFDFYAVHKVASLESYMTTTTGSKLAAWMKANNETETAADEIEWAEHEAEPTIVPPCDVVELIKTNEGRVHRELAQLLGAKSLKIKEEDRQYDKTLPRSLYHPSSYPKPWPFVPFSYDVPPLESIIPFRSLPKRLIVHDPWHLLRVQGGRSLAQEDTWTSKHDATYIYNLELSARGLERLKKETEEAKENAPEITPGQTVDHNIQNEVEGFMILPDPDVPDGPIEPPVFVITPPTPAPSTVDEAHLYLSINHEAGVGNHSYVYYAEWELPRSLLAPGILCRKCIDEDVDRILKEQDGEDGSKKEERWKTRSGELKHVRITDPGIAFQEYFSKGTDGSKSLENDGASIHTYIIKEATDETFRRYEGPVRPIKTTVRHRNLENAPYCHHYAQFASSNHPLTAKFRVVAKLSMRYDIHLNSEAMNYQAFPEHLFQHWSGFNVVYPIPDPVPVSAVVPQFYGYYVPDKSTAVEEEYLSPILLVEDCGKPIEPQKLDIDDTNECASLFYRFHDSGWLHRSIYPRNILQKPGPISAFPAFRGLGHGHDALRSAGGKRSFRLIDFGRSTTYDIGLLAISERSDVEKILKHTGNAFGDELVDYEV